jgi:hypothetical protein
LTTFCKELLHRISQKSYKRISPVSLREENLERATQEGSNNPQQENPTLVTISFSTFAGKT